MNIRELQIGNFRNYQDYHIAFGSSMTVLIGKNGIGKTNMLQAIIYALSCFFNKLKGHDNYDFLQSSQTKIKKFKTTDAYFGEVNNKEDYQYPVTIGMIADFHGVFLKWMYFKETLNSEISKKTLRGSFFTFLEFGFR